MTFGELWLLIERHRNSPDLRVVYYSGRFGLSDRFATLYDGDDPIMNVPIGELPIDKVRFIWDESYSGGVFDKLREAVMPAGTILKNLLDRDLIRTSPRIKALIAASRNPDRVEIYKEDGSQVASACNYEELIKEISDQLHRDRGLIP